MKKKKRHEISPFDFAHSISYTKENLFEKHSDVEGMYSPFIVDLVLSQHEDCVLVVNEANEFLHKMPKIAHYEFLLGSIRKRFRKSNWYGTKKSENIKLIMDALKISKEKAMEIIDLIPEEQINKYKIYLSDSYGGHATK